MQHYADLCSWRNGKTDCKAADEESPRLGKGVK